MGRRLVVRPSDGKDINLDIAESEIYDNIIYSRRIVESGLTMAIEYVGSNPLYIGEALPGTAVATAAWRIKKITWDGNNVTNIEWASGTAKFDKKWSTRTSYVYS